MENKTKYFMEGRKLKAPIEANDKKVANHRKKKQQGSKRAKELLLNV